MERREVSREEPGFQVGGGIIRQPPRLWRSWRIHVAWLFVASFGIYGGGWLSGRWTNRAQDMTVETMLATLADPQASDANVCSALSRLRAVSDAGFRNAAKHIGNTGKSGRDAKVVLDETEALIRRLREGK